ncbi:hypothetical protein [Burkholderia glumae]|uniref:hypothetical protein n=1 Tax=Burkholderia glumae TaxID=337 RepID=UPI002036929D|nr:hypothetical protein [Burkholderia glumae]MCM2547628.1 hypothetical protein [Burkholderia glumae]
MPKFTTRVVLHDIDQKSHPSYTKLHAEMEKEGFTRTIFGDGKDWHLPPAEYNYEGSITRAALLKKAQAAAVRVDKNYGVLITESVELGRIWHGLKPV